MGRRVAAEGLEKYGVGARVRRLRLRKKISLEELGRHANLSPALLSKLERDLVTPTLPTLMRIALVFGIGLSEFFIDDDHGAVVVRAADRIRFPELQGDEGSAYDFESLDYVATGRLMNAYLAEFRPVRGVLRTHSHDAAEFIFALTGQLRVQVEEIDHHLSAGDSMYLNPAVRHGYARTGDERCSALVITTASPAAATYERPKPAAAMSIVPLAQAR